MRLPNSSLSHRIIQNRSPIFFDNNMLSSSVYSTQLPYLGAIILEQSPANLTSFQKPLYDLYISYIRECSHNERRIIISNCDILIFEPDAALKGKRTFIYSNMESIVDIQALKLSVMSNKTENQQSNPMQAAFLPIGCEHNERFRSLYSTIDNFLVSTSYHPSLVLFVMHKSNTNGLCSLLDCHVFAVHRESTAFDLCYMIRKLIIKQTMSPILSKRAALIYINDDTKKTKTDSIERDQPIDIEILSDEENNHSVSNVIHSTTNTLLNPLSSSSLVINNVQHSLPYHDTSKVLTMRSDIHRQSSPCLTSKQRHFIKASSLNVDESDELVNNLMNKISKEKVSIKRHASFSTDYIMNKKRYLHNNKKRLLNSLPIIPNDPNPRIDSQLLRPHIVINRYGDIGNYVPKFLRENVTMRSSDSNENIFFRSTNGQLINSFLKFDLLTKRKTNEKNHYQSSGLNQEQNIFSLIQQLRKNQTKSCIDDDYQVPNGSKRPVKSRRITSFAGDKTELPVDYRQYLRRTDQGTYLYGEEQRQQTTLEHSLGYFP